MVDDYTKAYIYSAEKVFIGNAHVVAGQYGDTEVSLKIDDVVMGGMYTSIILTLCNSEYGLVTYKAEMTEFKKYFEDSSDYIVKCELVEMLDMIQRRENFKVQVSIPVTISLNDEDGNPLLDQIDEKPVQYSVTIKNLSASGVMFATKEKLEVGQFFDFMFDRTVHPFLVTAEILRKQEPEHEEEETGYGCRFMNLTVAKESVIRQYLFKLQLSRSGKNIVAIDLPN